MPLIQFGSAPRVYLFPLITLQDVDDNFGLVDLKTDRFPGMSGGFDVFGTGIGPSPVGRVTARFYLVATDPEDMTAKRDAVKAMKSWGVQRLEKQPSDPALPERWCRARVASISMPEQPAYHTDLHQEVQITFQVTDPRWYSKEDMWYLGDGETLDSGLTLQGPTPATVSSGDQVTITNEGTAPTKPVFTITTTPGVAWFIGDPYVIGQEALYVEEAGVGSVQGFGMRQIGEDGRVLNEWFWNGTVADGEQLVIDCGACSVRYEALTGSENGYPDFYITRGFAFPELLPGENTFELFGTFTGDVELSVEFFDAWS